MMIAINEKNRLAKPFLKWAGGKTQLISEIEKRLPKGISTGQTNSYVEPFVGGGALFFYIAQNYPKIKKFYLYDINNDLVNCYKIIQSDVFLLIKVLKVLETKFLPLNHNDRKEFYQDIRKKFNHEKINNSGVEVAAKLIFLNKTCFNGLYRVNSKNEFNVPFGDYKNPKICDERNLLAVSKVLQKTKIICGDFTKCRKHIDKNTFVYLDPPYRPLNGTANFTSYSKDSFAEDDQVRLAEFCRWIEQTGAKFLLSNSDPKNEDDNDYFFENNFKGFDICKIKASRMINCKAIGRGEIDELLITN
jgi:DNA adenine methylase